MLCCGPLSSQPAVPADTAKVTVRSINQNAVHRFSLDKDFQYENSVEPEMSLWQKFWLWVWSKIARIMSTKPGRITVWTVLTLVAVSVIVFFVSKITGMNKAGLFSRSSDGNLPYQVTDEDIHGISFDEAIEKAISEGNFRMAVRLLYLQSLKKLSDRGFIKWEINKTNTDYIFEVVNKPFYTLFKSLTKKFEYIWYGEAGLDKEDFYNMQLQFQQFNNQLQ